VFNANDVLFSTASLLHLCCVSVDRYVAITDPFNYDRKMSPRVVGWLLAGVWMTSTLVSHVPIHLGWYSADNRPLDHVTPPEVGDDVCVFEVNQVRISHVCIQGNQ
jgi:octopamine receptor beta